MTVQELRSPRQMEMTDLEVFCANDWANLLGDGKLGALRDHLLAEVAHYKGISIAEVERNATAWAEQYAQEWHEFVGRGKNPREFYVSQETEIYALCTWHSELGAVQARVGAINYARKEGVSKVLDFGSGIGSDAIVLAKLGFEVTLADVSETMLAFAQWRLARRGLTAGSLNLNSQSVPRQEFDLAISFDVLEHIPVSDLRKTLETIRSSLRPSGAFFLTVSTALDEPSHITSPEEVLRILRGVGFRWDYGEEGYVCRRVERSAVWNQLLGYYDYILFSVPILRRALRRRLERTAPGQKILQVYRALKRNRSSQ